MRDDREIREIVQLMHEKELEAMPSREELEKEYTLSDDFYNKMDALIAGRKAKKRNKRLVVAKFVTVAACFVMVLFGSVEKLEYIQADDGLQIEWRDEALYFHFDTDNDLTIPEYEIGYVPEKSELKESYYGSHLGFNMYYNGFLFYYAVCGGNMSINNNSCILKMAKMDDGNMVYYLEAQDKGYPSSLVWLTNENKYIFVLIGECSFDELKKGYESVRLVEE